MQAKPTKTPKTPKTPASKRLPGPKKVATPADKPKKTYVYRKDAFNKVLIT
jgi:hypothetical protein